MPLRLITLLCTVLLSACNEPPSASWNLTEQGGVFSVSFDAEAEHVLVGSVRHGGSLWRLSDRKRLYDWNHQAAGLSLLNATALAANGRFAATGEGRQLTLWDSASGQPLGSWLLDGHIQSLAVSDDGQRILAGLRDHNAVLMDTRLGQPLARIRHGSTVQAVVISRDGRIGATGADDGVVQLWDLDSGQARLTWRFASGLSSLALSDDQRLLFAGRYHGLGRIWQLSDGKRRTDIGHERGSISTARFSRDSRELLTGSPDGSTALWSTTDGQRLQQWRAPRQSFYSNRGMALVAVAFAKAPGRYYSALSDGRLLQWQRTPPP
jgi:WD40 repeat protein